MNQRRTTAIVLRRTDYGEANSIVTVLTPEDGKLRLMARGVRKVKSKLAGGIELFSVSDMTFIEGRGDIGTLISARLNRHYGRIVQHLERVQTGYELLKTLNKATEDHPEPAYFALLEQAFAALDDAAVDLELIRLWFGAQLLKIAGHAPNLRSDAQGRPLDAAAHYNFDFETMSFMPAERGNFQAPHIKLLRLTFADNAPAALQRIQDFKKLLVNVAPLVQTMFGTYIKL